MIESLLIGLIISSSVILIDQVSKIIMMGLLVNAPEFKIVLINNFLSLDLVFNDGAAFSMQLPKIVLIGLPLIASIIFFLMVKKSSPKKEPLYFWGMYMMIGGALGNLVDRAFAIDKTSLFGASAQAQTVVDFIHFDFFPATFNFADSFLCIGVALVFIDIIFFERKREKKNEFSSVEE